MQIPTGVFLFISGTAVGALLTAAAARRRRWALEELLRGIAAIGAGRPVRPVQSPVRGTLGRVTETFNEIAPRLERRIAELESDRRLLRAMLGNMAEGVAAVDARRRLLFANAAAARMLGIGLGSVGRLFVELIRSPQVQEAIEATLSGKGPGRVEVSVPDPEGRLLSQPLVLAIHGTPLPGTPPVGAVFVFHDVTETRRLERIRQDFVANASHELKTPVASIKAYAETLLDGALEDPRVNRRFLQSIDEQADRLDRLVLDMLSLARIESMQGTFEHVATPLAPIVRRCVDAQRERAATKDLDYRVEIAPEAEHFVVLADDEALRQIADNLVDNAIKYTPEGGRVAVILSADPENWARLEVADSGIGIPREDLHRVFERFYRVDKARSREVGGTGLGLSIVKHLAQTLNGQVSVESRVGVGSTFTVRLPLIAAESGPPGEPETRAVVQRLG